MSPLAIGLVILLIVFSGAVLGMLVGRRLPSDQLGGETKTVITAATAVVGTMSALMLGLLISNASSAFSTRDAEVTRISADIIRLDHLLRRYGPGADAARVALRRYTAMKFDDLFPQGRNKKPNVDNPATYKMLEHVEDMILTLRPGDDRRRWLMGEALRSAAEVGQNRWLLVQQNASFIPVPILILIVFWLTILFASFGLFAPKNLTATLALGLCAAAVSGGITMVLAMETPFEGIVRISSVPIYHALEVLGR